LIDIINGYKSFLRRREITRLLLAYAVVLVVILASRKQSAVGLSATSWITNSDNGDDDFNVLSFFCISIFILFYFV